MTGDDKHFTFVNLCDLVVAIATKVFIGFLWKAYVIDDPQDTCYRWEMIKISLQTVEI